MRTFFTKLLAGPGKPRRAEAPFLRQWDEMIAQLNQCLVDKPDLPEGQALHFGECLLQLLVSLREYDRLSDVAKARLLAPLDRFYVAAVHTLAERPLIATGESSDLQPQELSPCTALCRMLEQVELVSLSPTETRPCSEPEASLATPLTVASRHP